MAEKWSDLLAKDKLSAEEKIQEAAITEIINKQQLEVEDNKKQFVKVQTGPSIKYI